MELPDGTHILGGITFPKEGNTFIRDGQKLSKRGIEKSFWGVDVSGKEKKVAPEVAAAFADTMKQDFSSLQIGDIANFLDRREIKAVGGKVTNVTSKGATIELPGGKKITFPKKDYIGHFSAQEVAKARAEMGKEYSLKRRDDLLKKFDNNQIDSYIVQRLDSGIKKGEYRIAHDGDRKRILDGALRAFREFHKKTIPLSDGRIVYFSPDERAVLRNGSEALAWAEYAMHFVTSSGERLPAGFRERLFNDTKFNNLERIESIIKEENAFGKFDKNNSWNDAVIFVGASKDGKRLEIITRLDEYGNINANLTEVTALLSKKEAKINPPRNPLSEVVEAVAQHQAAGFSPSTNLNITSFDEKSSAETEKRSDLSDLSDISDNVDGVEYSLVRDPAKIRQLENEDYITTYRAVQMQNGKLYSPMAGKINGQWGTEIQLGKWEQTDERPELAKPVIDKLTGEQKKYGKKTDEGYGNPAFEFVLDKGNGKKITAKYNPYFHSSPTPLNDQFAEAYQRPELVTIEVRVPKSELTSGYHAEKAKNSVGMKEWKAGVVQGQLDGGRKVMLSRWDKPIRIVPDSEVAQMIKQMLAGKNIEIPANVVTPSLRQELEEIGVPVWDNLTEFSLQKQQKPYYQIPFAESVDNVIHGTDKGSGLVFVSATPKALKAIGVPGLPIMITRQHIKDIYNPSAPAGRNAHGMGEQLKHLPEMLEKPVAVIASKEKGRIVAITQYQDKDGKQIIVPVIIGTDTTADGNLRITANIAASTYGKTEASAILKEAVEQENNGQIAIFGANKKITSKLPMSGTPIVPEGGFNAIHNIHDNGSPVKGLFKENTDSLQFKRWFGDSKVVDENGEPMVVDGLYLNLDANPVDPDVFSWARKLAEKIHDAEKNTNTKYGSPEFLYAIDRKLEKELFSLDGFDDLVLGAIVNGKEPVYRIAFRYGDIPESGRSVNYQDNIWEKGVSVVGRVADLNIRKNNYYDAFWGKEDYNIVGGWDLGYTGSDGEMLLVYAKKLGSAKNVGKICKSATDNIGTFDKNNPDINYSLQKHSQVNPIREEGDIQEQYQRNLEGNAYEPKSKEVLNRQAERRIAGMGGIADTMKAILDGDLKAASDVSQRMMQKKSGQFQTFREPPRFFVVRAPGSRGIFAGSGFQPHLPQQFLSHQAM